MWLAIDTSAGICSAALIDEEAVVAAAAEHIGRGHDARLLPLIAALVDAQAPPAAVAVCVGPGSFTGLRVGIAAARALGLAWHVPVHGFTALSLAAAAGFGRGDAAGPLLAVADAGRGQLHAQIYNDPARPSGGAVHGSPAVVADAFGIRAACGHVPAALAELGFVDCLHGAPPVAADAALLPQSLRSLPPAAFYARPPDARPQPPECAAC